MVTVRSAFLMQKPSNQNTRKFARQVRRLAALSLLISTIAILWFLTRDEKSAFAATANTTTPQTIVFNRDIRPILSDRCFSCHGPDVNKRQAGLRLDRPDTATGALPKHPNLRAFVPGDPDHSEALRRILSTDPVLVMPPATSNHPLDAKEKELIRQWVIQGGPYQEHWAFSKPVRPPLPQLQNQSWAKNDIDRFVLANLESHGLAPSKQADNPTLIRRVSLDLTGIPPTPAEVDAFIADTSPNAYEKVVDRLLATPRYGEQMAVSWLDYARYADSHGYQSDPERHMWKWRDWVINAYNSNMPFDEFTIEQLAGDLLPNATVDQKVATGFNRNHRINDEGGIIPEEWRVEGVIDRVSTTSAVFLGLTMECCRCHDHKFDPITQKEFYSFSAYFNSIHEAGYGETGPTDRGVNVAPVLKVPSPEQQKQLDDLAAKVTAAQARIDELNKSLGDRATKLTMENANLTEPAGLLARFPLEGDIHCEDGQQYTVDTSYIGKTGPVFVDARNTKAVQFKGDGAAISGGDVLHFDRDSQFSYGAWINGKNGAFLSKMDTRHDFRGFDLYDENGRVSVHIIHHWSDNALKVKTIASLPKHSWTHVFATYDGSGKASGIKIYFDGKPKPTEVLNDHLTDTIITNSPVLIGGRDGNDAFDGEVADARIYDRVVDFHEIAVIGRGEEVRKILQQPADKRTAFQQDRLVGFVQATDPEFAKETDAINSAKKDSAALQAMIPDTMVMEELPQPRDTFVLLRGQYDKHGDKVTPGIPAVLPPLPKDAPPNRLGLARWIVDPANPLTSRVQANRLWEKFFGIGLVKTSENLGTQTEWPSNPELLDYLATEMVGLHWDLKAFQKEIVMSAAYQQASDVTPEMLENDPENRLVERGPRFRLSAEQVRDQALAVSGLLIENIGGPSAKPYEPADLWAGNNFGNLSQYITDKGAGLYRRSLYTFIKRSAVPANLSLFDQPSREYCVIRRSRTDTPLQALDLMNDPTYLEASRVLAEHLMRDVDATPAEKIAEGFKRVTCRPPTDAESAILVAGFEKDLAKYKKDPSAAKKLISFGESPRDTKLDPPELAAYTMTSSILLNLDETVTRQ
jgi:hypothetical protein